MADTNEDNLTYRIERCFADERPREIRETHLTLEEAKEHCNRPDTSGPGWFDAFYPEDNR